MIFECWPVRRWKLKTRTNEFARLIIFHRSKKCIHSSENKSRNKYGSIKYKSTARQTRKIDVYTTPQLRTSKDFIRDYNVFDDVGKN